MSIYLTCPFDKNELRKLKTGDKVFVTGTIYTARDLAHKRIYEAVKNGEKLPFDLNGNTIYYTGPCPAPPGEIIGSCGPTTSKRMDVYTPLLIEKGLAAAIGKGNRSEEVLSAAKKYGFVYFAAIGGAGALIAACVKKCELIAYEDLGAEAVYKLYVEKFPLIVAFDILGNDIYKK